MEACIFYLIFSFKYGSLNFLSHVFFEVLETKHVTWVVTRLHVS